MTLSPKAVGAGEDYVYQSLYEKKAKQLACMIVAGHYPSLDKVARLLASEDEKEVVI